MLVSAVLSALLANDIVCLAFAPVIALSAVRAGFNPVPFLLGLALASNIGSAATLIGNPQNMLIGSIANLIVVEQARLRGVEIGFREHARVGIPATLASLAVLWGWMAWAG
jgi:Na+/H+ antiporter NhaD/arsenite permease-like protein